MSLRFTVKVGYWLKIGQDGQLTGPFGAKLAKFLFFPRNATFIAINQLDRPFINMLGVKADVIRAIPDPPKLPINITTGPSFEALDCFLVSKIIGKKELRMHGFEETVEAIDGELRLSFLMLCSFLILLLKFSSSLPLSQLFWKFFLLLFDQKCEKLRKHSKTMRIALMTTVFIFFIKVILSTLINTERITLDLGRRINTIEELRRANLTLAFSDQFSCREAIHTRMNSLKGIHLTRDKVDIVAIWKMIKSKDTCALVERYLMDYMIPTVCVLAERGEIFSEKIHRSRDPIISRPHILYFHRHMNKYDMKNAIKWAHANMERGIYTMICRFGLKSFETAHTLPNMECTQSRENKPFAKPLAIQFILSFLRFQGLINVLASLIFLLEILVYLTYEI